MKKTNVIRILESNDITHQIYIYDFDESDLSGLKVAERVGADPACVFKTLVARGDKTGINVFCIPVNRILDLKKAASASGNKRAEMIKEKELFPLTGYVKGGCSPIGMKKKYPVFICNSALQSDKILVSAGIRGMQVSLSVQDLLKITGALPVCLY
ncbi:MAG: Cys-tRNA(Pro) deacylase [Ignavibacteriaceae bacterium]